MKKIPASMFVTVYASSFEEEIKDIARLREYLMKSGYEISGDYLCEVLTELNVFKMDKRAMFLRLQVPVKFRHGA